MSQDGRRRGRRSVMESPLSATWTPRVREKAVLVGVGHGMEEADLDELAALADSAGAEPVARVVQTRSDPDPATFVGRGKIDEIHRAVHRTGADAVILDDELSAGQLRNLEDRLGVKVIDRTALILDIFALHARSREGKAQVELAQLNYLLPRLRGWGEAMSRLGGGIGTRGPGETKLEVDRQHIKRRITKLRRDIKDLSRTRDVKRARRERSGVPQIAIAGYTNAGKSTLMNALTEASVLVADQVFATLDPTTRRLQLPNGRLAVLSDTVGFVGKLPHDLVEAFRSTLEEVTRADLILHVADASSPDVVEQVDAVRTVLGEIGAGTIPDVLALNKVDLLDDVARERVTRRFPRAVLVSAITGRGQQGLVAAVAEAIPRPPVEVTLLVPFGREDVTARLHREGEVLTEEPRDEGTLVRARVERRDVPRVAELMVDPSGPHTRAG
ncbi:MAG TPA: GTPase HflX [Actinomycetota bacterium]|jgi:GTP-binding protein HflX|nr:GTPase HflX [Actinomycetota bacterium]